MCSKHHTANAVYDLIQNQRTFDGQFGIDLLGQIDANGYHCLDESKVYAGGVLLKSRRGKIAVRLTRCERHLDFEMVESGRPHPDRPGRKSISGKPVDQAANGLAGLITRYAR